MSKIEEILLSKDIQAMDFRVPTDMKLLVDSMKEYAEYYAKIAIKNTMYKTIDIINDNTYQPNIISSKQTFDVDRVTMKIQNIDNNSVLPPHE